MIGKNFKYLLIDNSVFRFCRLKYFASSSIYRYRAILASKVFSEIEDAF